MDGNTFEVEIPFTFDEAVFEASVTAAGLAQPRTSSIDASLEFNGTEY